MKGQEPESSPVAASEVVAPLARALDQSEQVKTKVEECATALASVNTVLKQEIADGAPLEAVEEALETSEAIEVKVQECAEELATVNDALAEEIDERHLLQHLLSTSEVALAESRVQERSSKHQSLHDAVTGLPNLTLFRDRLESGIVQAERHGWRLAVMFLDLDRFKAINDTHGHDAGDQVLVLVAQRLSQFIRGGDTVSRRSGDEFLLLMLEAKDADTVARFAAKIGAQIAMPCEVKGVQLQVTPSIGIAIYPEDGLTAQELLTNADAAMYAAKAQRHGVILFSQMARTAVS